MAGDIPSRASRDYDGDGAEGWLAPELPRRRINPLQRLRIPTFAHLDNGQARHFVVVGAVDLNCFGGSVELPVKQWVAAVSQGRVTRLSPQNTLRKFTAPRHRRNRVASTQADGEQ